MTAVALRDQLQAHAAAVAAVADDWASREAPMAFKDIEKALREVVFAFARIAIMLFLALREEHLMPNYPAQIDHGDRKFRRGPGDASGRNPTTRSVSLHMGLIAARSLASRGLWFATALCRKRQRCRTPERRRSSALSTPTRLHTTSWTNTVHPLPRQHVLPQEALTLLDRAESSTPNRTAPRRLRGWSYSEPAFHRLLVARMFKKPSEEGDIELLARSHVGDTELGLPLAINRQT
jgi:hypothetical protein